MDSWLKGVFIVDRRSELLRESLMATVEVYSTKHDHAMKCQVSLIRRTVIVNCFKVIFVQLTVTLKKS